MTAGYVGRRVLQLIPAIVGIMLVGFVLVELAPGDPVLALAGEAGDAGYYEFMREKFGLDRPLPERLGAYMGNAVQGDFGLSYIHGRSAMTIVWERIPATLILAATALVISSTVGVGAGVTAALRANRLPDLSINGIALGLYAAPVFWIGQLALLLFALWLGLFPVQGMTSPGAPDAGLGRWLDLAHHLVLPALVLASQEIAATARLSRSALLDQLQLDYIRTARAKGCTELRVVVRHALRRALLPVVTLIGGRVGHLLSGAVVIEVVFSWPGIGRLLITAMETRDTPILLSIFFVVGLSVVLVNLLTDLTYGYLDPRIRFSARR